MKTGVSKLEFIKSLEETLKLSRLGIKELILEDEGNSVRVVYEDGYEVSVNITFNSGVAIIKDVINQI